MSSDQTLGRRITIWTALGLTALALAPAAVEGQRARGGGSGIAEAKRVAFKGKTSQGERVAFKIRRGKIQGPSYLIVHRGCGVQFTFTGASALHDGRFTFGSASSHFFRGRLGNGVAKGRAGIDFTDATCPGRGVRSVRFKAHRKG